MVVRARAGAALTLVMLLSAVAGCGGGADPDPGRSGSPAPGGPGLRAAWEVLVEGLDVPNDLADLGDGRLLIGDQTGRIEVWQDGALAGEPLLDLTDRVSPPARQAPELGLAGFAPHPAFLDNGRIFVFYTRPPAAGADREVERVDVLSEFTVPAGPDSERVLLELPQTGTDHVGGHLAFDPAGLLYLGLGEPGDDDQAQDPGTLPGSVIRIDVDGAEPYAVPPDNPFVAGGGAPEVFAYGFRNPFRLGWDDQLGLLAVDPMWTAKDQEVEVVTAGGNYGYPEVAPRLPGRSCYDPPGSAEPVDACRTGPDGQELRPPALEYDRNVGQIVSGAVRYGADRVPELSGRVLVADWQGTLLAATPAEDGQPWPAEPVEVSFPGDTPFTGYVWALDAGADGEVYALVTSRSFGAGDGAVYRLGPAG